MPGALVEYDDKGVPYYKWPPFPIPPPGANIIPFKDFKPSGIQVMMDDEVELDGENIPTVQLLVTHDGEARPKKKRKTQKTAGGEVVKRKPWWEDWAEGEDLRSNFKYDKFVFPLIRASSSTDLFSSTKKAAHDGPSDVRSRRFSKTTYLAFSHDRRKNRRRTMGQGPLIIIMSQKIIFDFVDSSRSLSV